MDRFYSLPETAKHFHCFTDVDDIKQHPDYVAAKSGEHEPAYRLVSEIASQFLQSLVGGVSRRYLLCFTLCARGWW